MSSPAHPRVIRRDSVSLWWFHGLCFISVLATALWAWDDDSVSPLLRVGVLAGVLAALLGASRAIPRTVTFDAEGGKPPPDAEPEQPGSWRLRSGAVGVGQIALGLFMLSGGLVLGALAIHLVGERLEAKKSHDWRPVPAEVIVSRTWTTTERVSNYTGRYSPPRISYRKVRHGALEFRFVLDGVEYVGTRFDVGGTRAEQAERFVVGQHVTAYVPPGNPAGAVLGRGSSSSSLGFVLMTVFVAVLAALSLLFGVGCVQGAFERSGWSGSSRSIVRRVRS